MSGKKPFFGAIILLASLIPLYAQSELKPRITVFPLENPSGDVQVDIISSNVQKTVELNLKMIDKYIIVENDVKEYSSAPEWMADYCEKNNIDDIIFGRALIGDASGAVFLEMSVYNRMENEISLSNSELAETYFDIFEASDRLAVAMMEGFSGMHLGFGGLKLTNTGDEGKYYVYIDGSLAGESVGSIPTVLNGERIVRIEQERMFEPLVVHEEKVLILEKQVADVKFAIPGLLDGESKELEKYENYIDKNWDSKYSSKRVDKRFDRLFELLENTEYSNTAAERKKAVEEKYAAWNAQKEEWGIVTGLSILDRKGGASLLLGAAGMFPAYTTESAPGWESSFTLNPKAGISLSYNILEYLGIQTELTFMQTTAEIKNDNILITQGAEFLMLELPVLVVYRLPGKVPGIYAGMVYQQRLNDGTVYMEQGDNRDEQDGNDEMIEPSGMAMVSGIQFEIPLNKNFMKFDFRYSRSLTDWTPEHDGSNEELYPDYFHFTVGYGIKFF